jgi:hypothetical protein
MEKKPDDKHQGQTINATPKPGGTQADKAKGKGDDAINDAAVSGHEPKERSPKEREP